MRIRSGQFNLGRPRLRDRRGPAVGVAFWQPNGATPLARSQARLRVIVAVRICVGGAPLLGLSSGPAGIDGSGPRPRIRCHQSPAGDVALPHPLPMLSTVSTAIGYRAAPSPGELRHSPGANFHRLEVGCPSEHPPRPVIPQWRGRGPDRQPRRPGWLDPMNRVSTRVQTLAHQPVGVLFWRTHRARPAGTQIVSPILACATSGLVAPGVRTRSGRAPCAHADPAIPVITVISSSPPRTCPARRPRLSIPRQHPPSGCEQRTGRRTAPRTRRGG